MLSTIREFCFLPRNPRRYYLDSRMRRLDRSSAIFQILAQSSGTVVSYSETAAESSNGWISVTTTILCSDTREILTITDLSGNVANCSVIQTTTGPVCSLTCLNGGRCVATDKCECLGDFHGDRCQYAGCPSPPVPENGRVFTGVRKYSVGDAVEWVCDDYHELVGSNTTTCCPSGWTGTVPQCVGSCSWSLWSECSAACGRGTRTRVATGPGCTQPSSGECSVAECCSWSAWSECSVTCGRGTRTRVATGSGCTQPSSEECGADTECDQDLKWKDLFIQYGIVKEEYDEGCPDVRERI